MRRSQAAYMLFEVMIALAIIAILVSVAIPSLRNSIEHHNDTILQSQLLKTIHLARQAAQASGMPVGVCKNNMHHVCGGNWDDGLLIFYDAEENGIIKDEKQIIAVMQVNVRKGKIHWRAFPRYRDYLRFAPHKWWANDNGIFWYCHVSNPSPSFAIVTNKSGSTRVVYPNENGDIKDSHGVALNC
jgi:Tfp pilus assembly protein FimT